jgi:predicted enzyme related to lactoylglutathione lyase
MPTIDAHDPGTICWIDLASTDAAGATEFYCELFNWTSTEPAENAGGYRMLLRDGREVAGLAPVWGDTDRSTWSTYVASADADQTCAAAVSSGGEVVMDAMDVLTAGRMAVLRDPPGAQISVWQPGEHQGYQVHSEPGAPIWSELMTRDLAAARAFYNSVFGWTAQQQDFDGVPYTIWKRRDHLVGGALEMDETWPEDTQSHWMVYIATADCDATARRCLELGGKVWHPPDDIGPGRCALLEDPAGAAFSVITLHRTS